MLAIAAVFVFAPSVFAEERCLKGNTGSCIRVSDNSSGGDVDVLQGQVSNTNVVTLGDGTLVAAIASYYAGGTGNTNPEYETIEGGIHYSNIVRYKIDLYASTDGGMQWNKVVVENKGLWYVDEIYGATCTNCMNKNTSLGFLGFDLKAAPQFDNTTGIFLASSFACSTGRNSLDIDNNGHITPDMDDNGTNEDTNGYAMPDDYANFMPWHAAKESCITDFNATNEKEGNIYLSVINYDRSTQKFRQMNSTRAITSSQDGTLSGDCSQGFCFGTRYGTDHPSIAIAGMYPRTHWELWVGYNAYRGNAVGGFDSWNWRSGPDQNVRNFDYPDNNNYFACYTDDYYNPSTLQDESICDPQAITTVAPSNTRELWVKRLLIDVGDGDRDGKEAEIIVKTLTDNYTTQISSDRTTGRGTCEADDFYAGKSCFLDADCDDPDNTNQPTVPHCDKGVINNYPTIDYRDKPDKRIIYDNAKLAQVRISYPSYAASEFYPSLGTIPFSMSQSCIDPFSASYPARCGEIGYTYQTVWNPNLVPPGPQGQYNSCTVVPGCTNPCAPTDYPSSNPACYPTCCTFANLVGYKAFSPWVIYSLSNNKPPPNNEPITETEEINNVPITQDKLYYRFARAYWNNDRYSIDWQPQIDLSSQTPASTGAKINWKNADASQNVSVISVLGLLEASDSVRYPQPTFSNPLNYGFQQTSTSPGNTQFFTTYVKIQKQDGAQADVPALIRVRYNSFASYNDPPGSQIYYPINPCGNAGGRNYEKSIHWYYPDFSFKACYTPEYENFQGLILADQSGDNNLFGDVKTGITPYLKAGPPVLGFGSESIASTNYSTVTVMVPGAPRSGPTRDLYHTNLYYTKLKYNTYYSTTMDDTWISKDIDNSPIYQQLTDNDPSNTSNILHPRLFSFISQSSNLFHPLTLFSRALGDIDPVMSNCTAENGTNPCHVAVSSEYNNNAIKGWAWASTIGWVSLSCENLGTCYSENPPWSTNENGNYYGVSLISNEAFTNKPLIGKAWSERIGYISFNRSDSINQANPCGDPPDKDFLYMDYVDDGIPVSYTNDCKILETSISDTDGTGIEFVVSDINNPTTPLDGFFTPNGDYGHPYNDLCSGCSGYLMIDDEIIKYDRTTAATGQIRIQTRAVDMSGHDSIQRSHAAGTAVYFIGSDLSGGGTKINHIYKGISHWDSSKYEIYGWARALAWKQYQEQYCKDPVSGNLEIGPGNAPPCDKEWGWIKLNGEWNTKNVGTIDNNPVICDTANLVLTSVDGYPDPATSGHNPESVCIMQTDESCYVAQYTAINYEQRSLQLTQPPQAGKCADGREVLWTTTLASNIDSSTTQMSLASNSGLFVPGKLKFLSGEIIGFSGIDGVSLQGVLRGQENTTAAAHMVNEQIVQVNEKGKYLVFGLPVGEYDPEVTLVGFGWSAPNADLPNASLESRYANNISGFGWINFEPSRLKYLFPYLRTLFNDIYSGSDIELRSPDEGLTPEQYTSTYLIQADGSIIPLSSEFPEATSGSYERCVVNCAGDEACAAACQNFQPGLNDVPSVLLESGSISSLGKLPDYDEISTIVSSCEKWNDATETFEAAPCADDQGSTAINIPSTDTLSWQAVANTGINKFGQRVVYCRANPDDHPDLYEQAASSNIFIDHQYNPPECAFGLSGGWTADTAFKLGDDNFICVESASVHGEIPPSGKVEISYIEGGNPVIATVTFTSVQEDISACGIGYQKMNLSPAYTGGDFQTMTLRETEQIRFRKINHSHDGLPLVYAFPYDYGFGLHDPDCPECDNTLTIRAASGFGEGYNMQFNNGDNIYDFAWGGHAAGDSFPAGT
ncbi:MAG: hypothetical protein WC547_04480, partial [Candidatus Omnitrophota bacterium]